MQVVISPKNMTVCRNYHTWLPRHSFYNSASIIKFFARFILTKRMLFGIIFWSQSELRTFISLLIEWCSPMACSRVEEILWQLLSPGFAHHLQFYVDRAKSDPQFLFFHASSTLLRLRVELELHSVHLEPCADCPINAVAKCDILDALSEAIRTRTGEQNDVAA